MSWHAKKKESANVYQNRDVSEWVSGSAEYAGLRKGRRLDGRINSR